MISWPPWRGGGGAEFTSHSSVSPPSRFNHLLLACSLAWLLKLENFLCTPIFNQPALFNGNYFLSFSISLFLHSSCSPPHPYPGELHIIFGSMVLDRLNWTGVTVKRFNFFLCFSFYSFCEKSFLETFICLITSNESWPRRIDNSILFFSLPGATPIFLELFFFASMQRKGDDFRTLFIALYFVFQRCRVMVPSFVSLAPWIGWAIAPGGAEWKLLMEVIEPDDGKHWVSVSFRDVGWCRCIYYRDKCTEK